MIYEHVSIEYGIVDDGNDAGDSNAVLLLKSEKIVDKIQITINCLFFSINRVHLPNELCIGCNADLVPFGRNKLLEICDFD